MRGRGEGVETGVGHIFLSQVIGMGGVDSVKSGTPTWTGWSLEHKNGSSCQDVCIKTGLRACDMNR